MYKQCMQLMTRLAAKGLVHCDFNEFNLLVSTRLPFYCASDCCPQPDELSWVVQIDESERLVLIDFPQMVSTTHTDALHLFQRDVDCVNRCRLTFACTLERQTRVC